MGWDKILQYDMVYARQGHDEWEIMLYGSEDKISGELLDCYNIQYFTYYQVRIAVTT